MATYYANVWATGRLTIGRETPEGAIWIAKGPEKALRKHFKVVCRHGYKRSVLLVPGVPEAANQDEGIKALQAFVRWASGTIDARRVPASIVYRGTPARAEGAH